MSNNCCIGSIITDSQGTVAVVPSNLAVGATPGNVRYEMNSGGQAAYDPQLLHLAQLGQYIELIEGLRFNNDPKALALQFGKSRGDGDPDSPTYHRRSQQGDRLFNLSTYGSIDFSFSHASYWFVSADYPSDNNNEQAAMQHISSSNAKSNGNGVQINSLAQVALPGPNRNPYPAGTDYKALLLLGPGGSFNGTYDVAPLLFTAGNLTATALPGAVEYNGEFHLTGATGARKMVVRTASPTFTTATTGGIGTISYVAGVDYVTITVVVGSSNVVSGGQVVARVNISPALPASFPTFGSLDGATASSGTAEEALPQFMYAGATNKIAVNLISGTMKAGSTYIWNVMFRV